VAEREKSLDQLIQLAMSVYYNWDITNRREKDKGQHNLIAAPTWLGPASWTCYHGGQEGHFCRGCSKVGTAWETAPPLSAKVTTGGLSAPASRWKVRCHLLWIDRSWPPAHASLLSINVDEPHGSHFGRKTKDHFLARQWSSFLCLTFVSWSLV
jgi:hypothetical protein